MWHSVPSDTEHTHMRGTFISQPQQRGWSKVWAAGDNTFQFWLRREAFRVITSLVVGKMTLENPLESRL